MTSIIYVTLLIFMLIVLYLCGKSLRKDYRLLSYAGIMSIFVYTLNEGLRFGRGIDYNVYWRLYEEGAKGWDIEKDYVFTMFSKILITIGLPYQVEVLIMSFVFILSTLLLLKNFKEIVPVTLPLFVLLSMHQVENMVRWYLAYSFILIGFSLLLRSDGKNTYVYSFFNNSFLYSFGLAPVLVVFYLVSLRKKPFFSPYITLLLFYGIYFFFDSAFMLNLVEYVNLFSLINSDITDIYLQNSEYWLTGGFSKMGALNTSIGIVQLITLSVLVIVGYKPLELAHNKNYVVSYNLFTIGLLLFPISKHIELMIRYTHVFLFFEAIVLSYFVYEYVINRRIIVSRVLLFVILLFFARHCSEEFVNPFRMPSYRYMYVWNKSSQTHDSMIQMYIDDMYKARMRAKENNK